MEIAQRIVATYMINFMNTTASPLGVTGPMHCTLLHMYYASIIMLLNQTDTFGIYVAIYMGD